MTAELIWVKGTMNCGKSGVILMLEDASACEDRATVIFKSCLDTRDGSNVYSRALGSSEAITVGLIASNQMYDYVKNTPVDMVFVDEIQFFSKEHIMELTRIVSELGVTVVVFGLMSNYQADLFEGSCTISALADHIVELISFCVYCGKRARLNLMVDGDLPVFDGSIIQIGGNEKYKAVCKECYFFAKQTGTLPKRVRRSLTS